MNDLKKGLGRPVARIDRIPAMLETKLEDEAAVLDLLVAELAKGNAHPELWDQLHQAAARDDLLAELAFAYEQLIGNRKMKLLAAAVQAEVLMHAATYHDEQFGDHEAAAKCLERVLAVAPAHDHALARLESLVRDEAGIVRLADLYLAAATQKSSKPEQLTMLQRAIELVAGLPNEQDRLARYYEEVLRIDPTQTEVRRALEPLYVRAGRFADLAKVLEQAAAASTPDDAEGIVLHTRLMRLYTGQLNEPERAAPHLEELLRMDPGNMEARTVAEMLLAHKGVAARAAAALAGAYEQLGKKQEAASMLTVQLEYLRGPRRSEVQKRLALIREELGDHVAAHALLEAILAMDATDDDVREHYIALSRRSGKMTEAARALGRAAAVAKDHGARARIGADLGKILLEVGDARRARTVLNDVVEQRADESAVLSAARTLVQLHADGRDPKALAAILQLLATSEPEAEARWNAAARLARLCENDLADRAGAIAAWRCLVDSPLREQALQSLEAHYEATGANDDLAGVLEMRAEASAEPEVARSFALRAAELRVGNDADKARTLAMWQQLLDKYGPSRDVHARILPLYEALGQWQNVAAILEADVALAPEDERPALRARLAHVRHAKLGDVERALEEYRQVLAADPEDRTTRRALEHLLDRGDHRLAAADLLEPVYRKANDASGLARVLEARAACEPPGERRWAALEEAVDLLGKDGRQARRAFDLAGKALQEAAAHDPARIPTWLARLDAIAKAEGSRIEPAAFASALVAALADRSLEASGLAELGDAATEALVAADDVRGAVALLERLLKSAPTPARQHRLERLVAEHGSAQERLVLHRTLLDQARDPRARRELFVTIAKIEQDEIGDPVAAITTWHRALEEAPGDTELEDALLDAYARAGDSGALYTQLDRGAARAAGERRIAMLLRMAEVAPDAGQKERAVEHYRELLQSASADPELYERIERAAQASNQAEVLRELYERRIATSPDRFERAEWLERLGDVYAERLGDKAAAVSSWKRAARLCDEPPPDPDRATRLYERALAAAPDDTEAAERLLALCGGSANWVKLPAVYVALLRNTTDERVALERLLQFEEHAVRLGAVDSFCEAVDELLDRHMAHASERAGELVAAKARVLSKDAARHAQAEALLAGLLSLQGDVPTIGAHRDGQRFALPWDRNEARDRDVRALLEMAAALETAGDVVGAVNTYRRALERDPSRLDAQFALPRLLPQVGDAEGALAVLLELADKATPAIRAALELQIAGLYLDALSRPADALPLLERRLDAAPGDAAIIPLLEKALARPEVRVQAAALLERAVARLEDDERAAALLDALLTSPADDPDLAGKRRGWYHRLLRRRRAEPEAALAVAARAVAELPDDEELWTRAEVLARQLERPAPVAEAYRKALEAAKEAEAIEQIGRRAVEFQEEWFDDADAVVALLRRMLAADRGGWALERLKLLFSSSARWDEFFALYDDAIAKAEAADERVDLLREAASAAKDIAKDARRAIAYLEQLAALRPDDATTSTLLERLYERGKHNRPLIALLSSRLGDATGQAAQALRARVASLLLTERDEVAAFSHIERMLEADPQSNQAFELLGKLVLTGGPDAGPRGSVRPTAQPSAEEGRAVATVPPTSARAQAPSIVNGEPHGARGVALGADERRRAATWLRQRYAKGPSDRLIAALEVLLTTATTDVDRTTHHRELVEARGAARDDRGVFAHLASLVELEHDDAATRKAFIELGARLGDHARVVEVVLGAAERAPSPAIGAALLVDAASVCRDGLRDPSRAIDLFFRAMRLGESDDAIVLRAARELEPLLAGAHRDAERCAVLERIAALEASGEGRRAALQKAARIAAEQLGDIDRAISLRRLQLDDNASDIEALDALVALLQGVRRHAELVATLEQRAGLLEPAAAKSDWIQIARIQATELGSPDGAIRAWRAVRERFGADDDSFEALAALFEATGRWEDLTELLEEHASVTEATERRVSLYGRLGDILRERTGSAARATTNYCEALMLDARDPIARRGLAAVLDRANLRPLAVDALARAYAATGDWDRASELARTLAPAEDVPREIAPTFWWEVARYERDVRGELPSAEAALYRTLSHKPNDIDVLSALAAVQQRMPSRALIDTLVRLSEARGGDAALVREASEVALHDLADRRLATELLERLLELATFQWTNVDADQAASGPDPRELATWSLERLVRLAHEDNKPARVVELLLRGAELPFDPAAVRRMRQEAAALRAERLGDPAGAVELYRGLIDDDPRDDIAKASEGPLADLLDQTGRHGELVALWEEQAKARSGDDAADVWARAAALAEKLGEADRAIADYRNAAELGHVTALEALARLLAERGDHGAVAKVLERLADLASPGARAEAALRLADAQLAAGDRASARARLEQAVERVPEADAICERLAELYKEDADWTELAALFAKQAKRTNDPVQRLARLREAADVQLSKRTDPSAAIPLLEEAVVLARNTPNVTLTLADALSAVGRKADAQGVLAAQIERYGTRRPKHRALVHLALARLLNESGDGPRALAELETAARIDPSHPGILRSLARVAREQGQLERAQRTYQAMLLLRLRPGDEVSRGEILLELAEIAEKLGDRTRAQELRESARVEEVAQSREEETPGDMDELDRGFADLESGN